MDGVQNGADSMNIFSTRLKIAREKAGLTQKELAEKLDIPPQMINRYENSDTEPRIGFVAKTAQILGVSADFLIGVKAMNETDLMHSVMLEASKAGNMIFRANVGKVRMADGRWFDTGLPKGHSDLYGFRPDGRVFYVETKMHPRVPTPEQVRFLQAVIKRGGIGGVAYSVDEAMEIIAWLPETQERVKEALDKWALKISAK